jgi:hypothetical protein
VRWDEFDFCAAHEIPAAQFHTQVPDRDGLHQEPCAEDFYRGAGVKGVLRGADCFVSYKFKHVILLITKQSRS